MAFVPRARVVKGLLHWMEKQTSCLEGCPHLVVLFDSIAGLCFYKRDHFVLTSVFIYIFNVLHSTQTIGIIGFIA